MTDPIRRIETTADQVLQSLDKAHVHMFVPVGQNLPATVAAIAPIIEKMQPFRNLEVDGQLMAHYRIPI